MKLLMTALLLISSQFAFASHCSKPAELPVRIREFALEKLAEICPLTVDQESMRIHKWSFSSWDTEENYSIHFKGRGYGVGDVDYDMTVVIETECRGPFYAELENIMIIAGCR